MEYNIKKLSNMTDDALDLALEMAEVA